MVQVLRSGGPAEAFSLLDHLVRWLSGLGF